MSLIEIPPSLWLERLQKISQASVSPWPRVSNNLFNSMQWMGKETVEKADRRYFGLKINEEIVASMMLYYLSETTLRARGLYCDETYRKQGFMRRCLELALENYKGKARQVISFTSAESIGFYQRTGFHIVSSWPSRSLEYFDFEKQTYVIDKEDPVLMVRKVLSN